MSYVTLLVSFMKVNIDMNTTAKELLKETMRRIDGAYAPSTIRAYRVNFERYIEFCENCQANALPTNANDIARYVAYLAKRGLKSASIRIAVASISSIHKLNQLDDPTLHPDVKIELRRMHRKLGRSSKQALGITMPMLEKMISTAKNDLWGLRDSALILLAYDSLCRRSELVSLRVEDIEYSESSLPRSIRLRRSKTDQEAIGKVIKLTAKTQQAICKWIECSKIEEGFLFRGIKNNGNISHGLNPSQINRIYKRLAEAANLPKEHIRNISGHSMRVGAAQDLLISGQSLPSIMVRGRWSKPDTAMRYLELCNLKT